MADVRQPANTLYLCEANNTGSGWWRGFLGTNATCTTVDSYYRETHNGGNNFGYADGHAKWIQGRKAFAPSKAAYDAYLPWSYNTDNVLGGY